jgi:hypothetical protein
MNDILQSLIKSVVTLATALIGIYTYLEQLRIANTSNVAREALNQLEHIRNKIWQVQHRSRTTEPVDSLTMSDKEIIDLQALFGTLQNSLYLLYGSPLIGKEEEDELRTLVNDCLEFLNYPHAMPLTLENNDSFMKLLERWGNGEKNHILRAKKTLSRIYQMADRINFSLIRWWY